MQSRLLKLLAFMWLLLIILLLGCALKSGPQFDSSIMSLLPKSAQQPLVQQAIGQMSEGFSQRLLLLVDGDDEKQVKAAVAQLAKGAGKLPEVTEVRWQVNDTDVQQAQAELFPQRFTLIDKTLLELLNNQQFQKIASLALAQIYSPLSAGKTDLINDPFGLHVHYLQQQQNDINVQISQSLLKVSGLAKPSYLVLLTLGGDPFSTTLQHAVLPFVASEQTRLSLLGINITMSGMILHAAAGAKQASGEISSIGLGSLIGIVLLMLLVFRQLKPLVLMLVPVLVGCLTATAVTLLVFERIHLITLAFGAGLVGVSIDYALHFLCAKRLNSADKVLKKILPGLLLGLFSSVMAYAAQAFAPFPGLQQMAVFSVVGLIASWLSVVLWLPWLTQNYPIQALSLAPKLQYLRSKIPLLTDSPLLLTGLLILAMGSIFIIANDKSLDDIRLLQTSPASLLLQEQSMQKKLGTSSSTQFLLIKADSLQECLQQEENLLPALKQLQDQGLLVKFQALSQHLPSAQQQHKNWLAIQQLYTQQLPGFYEKLHLGASKLQQAQAVFSNTEQQFVDADEWLKLSSSEAWRQMLVSQQPHNSATMLRFVGALDSHSKAALRKTLEDYPQVIFVDQVENISVLMQNYRQHISQFIAIAYLLVLVVLFWRYKLQVWRIVLPPVLASLLTLASLILLEHGMNLFHLMAMILVLGIGLDMGIFLAESDDDPHTWLAVSLSSLTSLLAFGLLALSATPVLHHFGLTVLIGLTLVWILAPAMGRVYQHNNNTGDTLK